MLRQLKRIEQSGSSRWGCSACAWTFDPSETPSVSSLDEMTLALILQREKDFESHICSKHRKIKASAT